MDEQNKYRTLKIAKIEKENNKIKNFILDGDIEAQPGQYIMMWIPGMNEKPFGVLTDKPFSMSIASVGEFTQKLHESKVGDMISFRGPYGSSFKIQSGKRIFVAGGYGYVPLYFFATKMLETQRKETTVIIGARDKENLAFVKKFEELGCKVEVTTDDGSEGTKGFSTDMLKKLIENEKYDAIYSCGPEIMNTKVSEIAKMNNIFCQVSSESYFKCGGMGLCGECSRNGVLLCCEGPILDQ